MIAALVALWVSPIHAGAQLSGPGRAGPRIPVSALDRSVATPSGGGADPLSSPVAVQEREVGTGALLGAGLLGAVVGFVGGALAGYQIERRFFPCSCDDPGLIGLIAGGIAGPVVAIPVSVHLANGRRGSFTRSLGVSALVAAVSAVGLAATSDSEAGLVFLFLPPFVEIGLSVGIEKSTSPRLFSP